MFVKAGVMLDHTGVAAEASRYKNIATAFQNIFALIQNAVAMVDAESAVFLEVARGDGCVRNALNTRRISSLVIAYLAHEILKFVAVDKRIVLHRRAVVVNGLR